MSPLSPDGVTLTDHSLQKKNKMQIWNRELNQMLSVTVKFDKFTYI